MLKNILRLLAGIYVILVFVFLGSDFSPLLLWEPTRDWYNALPSKLLLFLIFSAVVLGTILGEIHKPRQDHECHCKS